jgi:hypothetical protein
MKKYGLDTESELEQDTGGALSRAIDSLDEFYPVLFKCLSAYFRNSRKISVNKIVGDGFQISTSAGSNKQETELCRIFLRISFPSANTDFFKVLYIRGNPPFDLNELRSFIIAKTGYRIEIDGLSSFYKFPPPNIT